MQAETILYIIIAAIAAFALAVFVYGYKVKYTASLKWLLGSLRFLTLFAIFILLINPKFKTETYTVEKPKLPILVDLSSSIEALDANTQVANFVATLQQSESLQEKFDMSFYGFGETFNRLDSIAFVDKQTQLDKALKATEALFRNETAPTILITDGNQTLGQDYEFLGQNFSNKIYPVVVGDTTQYVDLRIEQLNTNRYSFLKNEFPVEVILVYSGKEPIASTFTVAKGNQVVYSQNLNFTKEQNTQTLSFSLASKRVGLQRYVASIQPLSEEKNKTNNHKSFAVEVIDQATEILIVSELLHPDLGALKKSIETNEQRRVTFMKPSTAASVIDAYQLVILYQPTSAFNQVFQQINSLKKNTLLFCGLKTDWNFLNQTQSIFQKETTNASEDVTATMNLNYGSYALDDFGVSDYPPLRTAFGELTITVPNEVLLEQQVSGFDTGTALTATVDIDGKRDAIWDGEGIWKWRAQSYLNSESFQDFDVFLGKMIQYLASNKRRSRLEVASETFYYNNRNIVISAQYFDKNFVFDTRAQLSIQVKNQKDETITNFPMLLKNNYFEVDLRSLEAGDYSYTIVVENEAVSRSSSFTILDYNVEQQFLNANVTKLRRLATYTGGKDYLMESHDNLIAELLADETLKPIQKPIQKVVPLVDWKYLLALIAFFLASEWFIRKYNGLI